MSDIDDLLKQAVEEFKEGEAEAEPKPQAKIKKKPGPKPGSKKAKKTGTNVPEQKSVPHLPEVSPARCQPGRAVSLWDDKKSENNFDSSDGSKEDQSAAAPDNINAGIHLPVNMHIRKQLEGDLIIIANEINELTDRKLAIESFLKDWK